MIQAGDEFQISFGGGKVLTAKALTLGQQRKLSKCVSKLIKIEESGDGLALFDLADEALKIAVPDDAKRLVDEIDAEQAIEIATKVLGKQSLSDDELGKSESQP